MLYRTDDGDLVKDKHPGAYDLLQKREAVRLGVEFQVGGKYCSFVAIEADRDEMEEERKKALEALSNRGDARKVEENEDWEVLQTRKYIRFLSLYIMSSNMTISSLSRVRWAAGSTDV